MSLSVNLSTDPYMVTTLFLHQHSLADAIHLHILTEDTVAIASQISAFFCSHLFVVTQSTQYPASASHYLYCMMFLVIYCGGHI